MMELEKHLLVIIINIITDSGKNHQMYTKAKVWRGEEYRNHLISLHKICNFYTEESLTKWSE